MLYFCLLLYVALIYIRPAEIVPAWSAVPFVDILTGSSLIVGAMAMVMKPRRLLNVPHDKLLLGFWAIIAISTMKVWLGGVYYAWFAFLPAMFCYFLARAAIQTERQLRGIVYLLIALNVFLAVNGIVQYRTGVGLGGVTMNLDRIYGTGIFNDPNDLGMTFVMSVPFIVLVASSSASGFVLRFLALLSFGTILWATYYTNSRGALLGLAAGLTCYSFMKFRSYSALVVAGLLVGVIWIAAPSRSNEIGAEDESAQGRVQAWASGWQMLRSNPVTGVGYGQFTEFHEREAHNSFVHTFAELGLTGAFCFVGVFYWYFKGLKATPQMTAGAIAWHRALTASGVGSLACMWFLSRQYVIVVYLLVAIGAAAMAIQREKAGEHEVIMSWRDVANVGGLVIFGLFAVTFSIRVLAIWD